jgi:hypothetical protein
MIRSTLHVLLLDLVLLRLFFLLGCHVVANRTASGRPKDAVVRHVTGGAADYGARYAALRVGRA